MGEHMAADQKISKALAALLPGGALGASILLALTSTACEARSSQASEAAPQANVAERLAAIRAVVSDIGAAATRGSSGSAEFGLADAPTAEQTWWGNGGWGRWHLGWGNGGFGWPNWHNWHNGGWGNGGWGNGGWNNGGWHNYWHNW
jgi:rSAM-associated Gly-rich repeat protein